jgi:hypothetical protein
MRSVDVLAGTPRGLSLARRQEGDDKSNPTSPQAAQNEAGKIHPQTRQIVHTVAIFEHEGLGVERVGRSEPEGFAIGGSLCLDCTLTIPLASPWSALEFCCLRPWRLSSDQFALVTRRSIQARHTMCRVLFVGPSAGHHDFCSGLRGGPSALIWRKIVKTRT